MHKISTNQLTLYLAEIGMRGKGVFHFVRTRLEGS